MGRFKCLRAPLFAALFVGSGVRERKQGERQRGPENVVAGNMEELHFSFEVCFFFVGLLFMTIPGSLQQHSKKYGVPFACNKLPMHMSPTTGRLFSRDIPRMNTSD